MKSSSLTKQGSRRAYAEGTYHTVKEGDSLEKIANRYGISKDTIIWANDIEEGVPIQPNDELLILPVDGILHTVSRGQTLLGIAELYDVSSDRIAEQNNVAGGFIMAGQELIVPGAAPLVSRPTEIAQAPDQPQPTSAEQPTEPVAQPAEQPTPPTPTPPARAEYTSSPSEGVLQKPCSDECFITQYFHAGHYALDMQERGGGPIYSAEAGTVIRADYGWNGGYGNVVEVDHGNGLVTLYGHNSDLLVKEGSFVQRGQKIANMGATGLVYGPTGIHVHFEVRVHGVKKNPMLYIK